MHTEGRSKGKEAFVQFSFQKYQDFCVFFWMGGGHMVHPSFRNFKTFVVYVPTFCANPRIF